jgi:predicted DNA-binding WGR domain protein
VAPRTGVGPRAWSRASPGEEPAEAPVAALPAEPELEPEPEPAPPTKPVADAPVGERLEPAPLPVETPGGISFQRTLEFVGGGSSKFWEIRVRGSETVVRFGRIGTAGQVHSVGHPTEEIARAEARKLVESKIRKGYVEVSAAREGP